MMLNIDVERSKGTFLVCILVLNTLFFFSRVLTINGGVLIVEGLLVYLDVYKSYLKCEGSFVCNLFILYLCRQYI